MTKKDKENYKKKNNTKFTMIYIAFILISVVMLLLNIPIIIEQNSIGTVSLFITIITIIVSIILYIIGNKRIFTTLVYDSQSYGKLNKTIVDEFAIPYATINSQGLVIWMNKGFRELFNKKKSFHGSIFDIFPQFDIEAMPSKNGEKLVFETKLNNINLRLEFIYIEIEEDGILNKYYSLYVYDDTEIKDSLKKITDEKTVIALVYIDNYEELLGNVEDVRKTVLVALIERKIGKYFEESHGIVKRLDKDKFIVIFQRWFLDKLIAERFKLLEDVKSVFIGNDTSATISIGIGLSDEGIEKSNEFATIAIDLALGRGGDQCVVKEKDHIEYFGGNTQSVEKNTRVKARIKAQALREIMMSKDQIIIMGHRMTDVDSLGAGIGIYRAALTINKKAHIVVNTISTSLKPLISPFINNSSYDPNMFIKSEEAIKICDKNTVVVVVDTNRPSYTECPELLQISNSVVVFDHHRQSEDIITNAILSYIETYASSASEMIAEMLPYFGDQVKLKPQEADCIYSGIMIDTNNFTAKTGARTFEAAAYLKRNGADVTRVRKMFRDDLNAYQARAEAISTAKVYNNSFAISICPSEGLESPNIVGAQAANGLLDIKGIKASFIITEYNGEAFISARSIDEINVQIIMEKMGGGGHLNIAGCQLKCSAEEAKAYLIKTLDEMSKEGDF